MIKVLVCDDDKECRSTFGTILALIPGLEVSYAKDGVEAWKTLNAERFSLLILDVNMPEVGGMPVLERIRAKSRFPDLPVMLCTGNLSRELVLAAARLRVTSFVAKPFDVKATLDKIDKVLPVRGRTLVIT